MRWTRCSAPSPSLGESTFLGRMLRGGTVRSLILWGPPGSGKTTIARLLAARSDAELESLSAVLDGIKELREVVARAKARREREGRATVLFVDEIHRFNKAQQDAFLPHVEAGHLRSDRCDHREPVVRGHRAVAVTLPRGRARAARPSTHSRQLIDRALSDAERGLGTLALAIEPDARRFIADSAHGDARVALGALEASADLAKETRAITLAIAEQGVQRKALLYDKAGDEHYNVISAFIKSMRGSDPDAALYWLARMLEAGEDPLFIARRMVVFASEDVGLADPQALPLAIGGERRRALRRPARSAHQSRARCGVFGPRAEIECVVRGVRRSGRGGRTNRARCPVPKHLAKRADRAHARSRLRQRLRLSSRPRRGGESARATCPMRSRVDASSPATHAATNASS